MDKNLTINNIKDIGNFENNFIFFINNLEKSISENFPKLSQLLNEKIIVEFFESFQGEGLTTGQKRLFIRLKNCNLNCYWCDTNWKSANYTVKDLIIYIFFNKKKFENSGLKLLFTGGEPLLWQDFLLDIINFLENHFNLFVEVETNGSLTILNKNKELLRKINLFNISPKSYISQSVNINKNGEKKTFIELKLLKQLLDNNLRKFILKFVYSEEEKDNIKNFYDYLKEAYRIKEDKVFIMPLASNKEELESNSRKAWQFALENGFNYSDRLHIRIWNKKMSI